MTPKTAVETRPWQAPASDAPARGSCPAARGSLHSSTWPSCSQRRACSRSCALAAPCKSPLSFTPMRPKPPATHRRCHAPRARPPAPPLPPPLPAAPPAHPTCQTTAPSAPAPRRTTGSAGPTPAAPACPAPWTTVRREREGRGWQCTSCDRSFFFGCCPAMRIRGGRELIRASGRCADLLAGCPAWAALCPACFAQAHWPDHPRAPPPAGLLAS